MKKVIFLVMVPVLLVLFLTGQALAAEYPTWAVSTAYEKGDIVVFSGKYYECIQAHNSISSWSPTTATTLWKQIAEPTPTPSATATPSPTPTPTPEPTATPPPDISPSLPPDVADWDMTDMAQCLKNIETLLFVLVVVVSAILGAFLAAVIVRFFFHGL